MKAITNSLFLLKNTFWRRIVLFLFIGITVLFSCKTFKPIHQSADAFYSNRDVLEAFGNYNVYIHDSKNTYEVGSPVVTNEGIEGNAHLISDSSAIAQIKNPTSGKDKKAHKYDLNFYTDKKITDNITASGSTEKNPAEKIILKRKDIKDVTINAVDGKELGFILLILILACLALAGIIWLIVATTVAGSKGSAAASNESSAGSKSDSKSDGSSGSCYIATMVYGSYEAPEVMVLRRFRDNFLSTFYLGRQFIRVYYKYSPLFVARFRNNQTVHKPIRFLLNHFVKFLSN